MRLALVSPYSWTYPGGVTRHIEGLAEQFLSEGHDVSVLAPFDPPGRRSALLHGGAEPQEMPVPDYLVPLGPTVGIRANGAVSNLSLSPPAAVVLHRELRRGRYDVVHVHEPDAPALGWAALGTAASPLVGTFHTYNEHRFSHGIATALGTRQMLNHLHVRIAVSEPAAWTARRFFGGHYRVIHNGVRLDRRPTPPAPDSARRCLRLVFVGQPVARKGLPVLIRVFEGLRERVPVELTLIGPSPGDVEGLLADRRGLHALGKVDDERKQAELAAADVLCAPSLGGESFGMVLTEAFAAGTPVVASDIPGYRDVVRDGVDGLLVRPGDPEALSEALHELWIDPQRRAVLAGSASESAERFAWPKVAAEVIVAYHDAAATTAPTGRLRRAGVRVGALPADLKPRAPARRLPSLEPRASRPRPEGRGKGRRALSLVIALMAVALAVLALRKMGVSKVTSALSQAQPGWIVLGVALMCAAMMSRAISWHASLQAGLPAAHIRLRQTMRALFIGVLVSSTLPANLGEPSRALVVVRRTEHPWANLPVVAGTMVSQTLLNIVALLILGVISFTSANLFASYRLAVVVALAVVVIAVSAVAIVPALLGRAHLGTRMTRIQSVATSLRSGLTVFRRPRLASVSVIGQLGAWVLQWLAVYVLLAGLNLAGRTGVVGAVGVLFAINITMLLPVTPGDIGVFQAAVAAVLHSGWHVAYSRGVAYGVVLQAAELMTAIVMGLPALLQEGLSWRAIASGRVLAERRRETPGEKVR
jgi:phosphatidyl-myo-inositol alpha-mannosyltransferase